MEHNHADMDHGSMDMNMDHGSMNMGMDHDKMAMDHDKMDMPRYHTDMNMAMYFHGGYNEVILFDFWRISSLAGLIGSMVACFALAVVYEAIKFYREHVFRNNMRQYSSVSTADRPNAAGAATAAATTTSAASTQPIEAASSEASLSMVRAAEVNIWSRGHILLTGLHFLQVSLAYLLMLIFMTYNSWLCLATVLGATAGYFLFGWKKTAVVFEEAEHCH